MNNYKILDLSILFLIGLFLVGIGITEYKAFGLEQPLIETPKELKTFFEFLILPIIGLLIMDIGIKYKKTNDFKKFLKKYWIDITMLALIPIFSAFKFFKFGLTLTKQLKTFKMGAKALHKTTKVTK